MGIGCMKGNENVYFQARKNASTRDERLFSREGAADLLGVSVSTLADYELGNTKVVPVDKVVLMADMYRCPELKVQYCKKECPIGRQLPIATAVGTPEGMALRFLKEFDDVRIDAVRSGLVSIFADGEVSDDEKNKLQNILGIIDNLALVISEFRLLGEKLEKG